MYDQIEFGASKYSLAEISHCEQALVKIDFKSMLIALAPYGGPLALTSNKTQYLLYSSKDLTLKNILIFDGTSKRLNLIPFDIKSQVVLFDWLQHQLLLVLMLDGTYYLVDPIGTTIGKAYSVSKYLKSGKIQQAKAVDRGFVFFSTNNFYIVKNAQQDAVVQTKQVGLSMQAFCWMPVSSHYSPSGKIEVQAAHHEAGVVLLIDSDLRKVYYNRNIKQHMVEERLPHLPQIKLMAISRGNLTAYFCCPAKITAPRGKDSKDQVVLQGYQHKIFMVSSDYQASSCVQINLGLQKQMQLPEQMLWVGDQCLALVYQQGEFKYIELLDRSSSRRKVDQIRAKQLVLRQQLDGLRIVTDKFRLLRKVPEAYERTKKALSQNPGAILYHAYQAFKDKEPFQDDSIRSNKELLAQAVEDCLSAAAYETDIDEMMKLMHASVYGKSFLNSDKFNNNKFQQQCKIMRVLNSIRNSPPRRLITHQQYQSLSEDRLLEMLLRYNQHYLAFEINRFLKNGDKWKLKIYTHWACCKVKSEQSIQEICRTIRQKIEHEKGFSYTEIARKAIELNKGQLALQLLTFQPSMAKKIPLLLWIGQQRDEDFIKYQQKAIVEASRSKDPNLAYLVIQKLRKTMSEDKLFQFFNANEFLRACLINYLKATQPSMLLSFYASNRMDEEFLMFKLQFAMRLKGKEQIQTLQQIAESLRSSNSWRKQSILDAIKNISDFQLSRSDKRVKDADLTIMTVNQIHLNLLSKDKDAAAKFAKEYHISENRSVNIQLAHMLKTSRWQNIQKYVQKNSKKLKFQPIVLADRFKRIKQASHAEKMLAYISPRDDDVYDIMLRIDWIQKAVMFACDNKKRQIAESMVSSINDAKLRQWAQSKLDQLRRKK